MLRSRPTFALATALFFLSGALGLLYELVWIRQAALVVGASQIALATVLTSFFMGLGLGSLVVGRLGWRAGPSPLLAYGLLEAAIGVFAVLFPWLFGRLEAVYGVLYPAFEASPGGLFLLRFTLLFVLFLPPTFFMGGTLPLLLDGLVRTDAAIGSRTSFLYGINTLGGVAGVLLTSYVAVPQLGMTATSIAAGAANLLLGATAVAAFRQPAAEASVLRRPGASPGRQVAPLFVILSCASGAVAIGYQVAWARYFSLFSVSTVYFTALLLAVFLLALATGSLLLAPALAARFDPLRVIAWLQPLAALSAVYGLQGWRGAFYRLTMIGNSPESIESYEVVASWHLWSETADATFFAPLFQIALSTFVPVVLLGTTLPALIAATTRRRESLRAIAGTLLFGNTLGASAGGFAVGYVLIPALGLGGTLGVLAAGSLAIGAAAAWSSGRALGGSVRSRMVPAAPVIAGLLLLVPRTAGLMNVTATTIRHFGWGGEVLEDRLVDVREGPVTAAYVFDGADRRTIGSGNVAMAVADHHWPSTQAIQGHVPALFYSGDRAPERALGIGLGSGQSFGALLLQGIAHLDVVDISPEMVVLSLRHFAEYNHGLGSDPRVAIHLDDGRHFVARAPAASYDIVSMEPPPPTLDGVYALYSEEFYRSVRRVLRENGVFMQWLPLYRVTPADALGILKTQVAVFPETFVVKVGRVDLMVVSFLTNGPPRLSLARIRERARRFAAERLVAGARWEPECRYEMASLEGVLSMILAGPRDVAAVEASVYHDDDARLAYSSGDRELLRRYEGPFLASLTFAALPLTPFADLAAYFDGPIPAAALDEERAHALAFFHVPDPTRLRTAIAEFDATANPVTKVWLATSIAGAYDGWLAKDRAFAWLEKAVAAYPAATDPEYLALARRVVRNRVAAYEPTVRRWVTLLGERYPGAPLVEAMRVEFAEHEARERYLARRYPWSRQPDAPRTAQAR